MPSSFDLPLSQNAPRYTSYPTAPHFHSGIGEADLRTWIAELGPGDDVSLYIHIPFCDKLCWFCACHTRHTLRYRSVADYLAALHAEIALVAAAIPRGPRVASLHLGGGSPTILRPDDFLQLVQAIRDAFQVADDLAISVEIDPSDVDDPRLDAYAAAGVTRASLGVQDFDPKVQQAINRQQGFALTRDVSQGLRRRGISRLNIDLVYGLPFQTTDGIARTVAQCLELSPDRLALFGYAHVPWMKKHQTMIDEAVLPGPVERLEQSAAAAALIAGAGYEAIGIDHFARPDDPLATAFREGRGRRNFQGYTDCAASALIGIGPSSVSNFKKGHAQNTPDMTTYVRAIEAGRLPVARGIALSLEDRARGWVIERLMCDFAFDDDRLAEIAGDCAPVIRSEAGSLVRAGRMVRDRNRLVIPEALRPQARAIAALFDPYFTGGSARHSLAV